MLNLEESLLAIKNDRTRGATELAEQALDIMGQAIFSLPAADHEELASGLERLAKNLMEVRPTMAVIKKAVTRCMAGIQTELLSEKRENPDFRQAAYLALAEVRRQMAQEREKAVEAASRLIKPNSTVATASYSSTVLRAFKRARLLGISFSVVLLASQVGNLEYGRILANRLEELDVPYLLLRDQEVAKAAALADLILLGADAVLPDGTVVNGHSSLSLCQAAKEATPPRPVYIVCDPMRYVDDLMPVEEGFDLVPSDLIERIIS